MAYPAMHEDEGNHQEQVGELIKQTAASIDDLALKMLFVTVQQNNLEVCIECTVNRSVVFLPIVSSHFIFLFQVHLRGCFNIGTLSLEFRDTSTQMNEVGLDLLDHLLVRTLLL